MTGGVSGTRPIGLRTAAILCLVGMVPACSAPRLPLEPLPAIPGVMAGYRATAQVTWKRGATKAGGRAGVAFRPPAEIRVEVFDPAGGVALAVVSSGEGALTLDPGRRSYRRFSSGAAAMQALVGLELPPERLAQALLGPAPGEGSGDLGFRWRRDDGSALPAPPRVTEIRHPRRRGLLRVVLAEIRFESPDPELFRLDPPPGFHPEAEGEENPTGGTAR